MSKLPDIKYCVGSKNLTKEFTTSPFILHLLQMDERIQLYDFMSSGFDDRGHVLFFTRDRMIIPCGVIPRIEHEIAHIVEMNDKSRWTKPDLGMPTLRKCSQIVNGYAVLQRQPSLFKRQRAFFTALAREVRVAAIQTYLNPERELTSASSRWSYGTENLLPYAGFKSFADIKTWDEKLTTTTKAAWSLDRIETEWKTRLNYIQNWMETQ